jgi:hypothetical protein
MEFVLANSKFPNTFHILLNGGVGLIYIHERFYISGEFSMS